MSPAPTISVVIPAYNAEAYVARAIESALTQTHPVLEILVVDDGSRDQTAVVAGQFVSPVRVLQQPNGGPSAARNLGVREARGEWIAFLDADDAWLPHKLERQSQYFADDRTGIVHCHIVNVPDRFLYDGEMTFDRLWRQNMIGTSTAVIRKSMWEQLGGFIEDRTLIGAEDYNFWLRAAAAGWRIALCPEELTHYTPAAFSLSSQIERVLRGELLNAELIAAAANLPRSQLRAKQSAIHREYGTGLLHQRDMPAARRSLAAALRLQPSLRTALQLATTFVPASFLDIARSATRWTQALPGAPARSPPAPG